jgi:putative two-component system response regulator
VIAKQQATLLVVDDSVESLAILNELLRPLYRVLAATSGEAGLRIALGDPRPT